MITIYINDNLTQVVKVSPQFFHTVVYGSGKYKRTITPQEKALGIANDILNGKFKGFILEQGDVVIANYGNTTTNKQTALKQPLNQRKEYAKKLTEWKGDISFQNNELVQHGLTANQIFAKKATKFMLASSTYTGNKGKKHVEKKLQLV